MADITRWDPFSDMTSLRRAIDRMFEEPFTWRSLWNGVDGGATAFFPVDVYATNDDVVVKASLPGVKPEDIDISVTGQVLTLKGESKEEHEEKAENYYRRERTHGAFVRQIGLPTEVDSAKAQATFENGVLHLTLPKAEAMKPKTIKVQAKPLIESKASADRAA